MLLKSLKKRKKNLDLVNIRLQKVFIQQINPYICNLIQLKAK